MLVEFDIFKTMRRVVKLLWVVFWRQLCELR